MSKNAGVASARNLGAALTSGEFIIFLDSDVKVYPKQILKMVDYLNCNPNVATAGAVPSGINLNHQSSTANIVAAKTKWPLLKFHNTDFIHTSCFQSECTIIRREVFEKIGGFDEKYTSVGMEEFELGHRLLLNNYNNHLLLNCEYDAYYKSVPQRIKVLFFRSMRWIPLFFKRKKLESSGLNGEKEEIPSLFNTLVLLTSFFLSTPYLVVACLLITIILERRFLLFVRKTHGIRSAFLAPIAIILFNVAIISGMTVGLCSVFFNFFRFTIQKLGVCNGSH
jgi:GT2 family glycosyltransferase